jgi:hypothetical protein
MKKRKDYKIENPTSPETEEQALNNHQRSPIQRRTVK